MAAFSTLTADQKNQLLAFMTMFRGGCVALVQAINRGTALNLVWTDSVGTIVASLDASGEIPDQTGLAGAVGLLPADVAALMTLIQGLLASAATNANEAEMLKAIGPTNMSGS